MIQNRGNQEEPNIALVIKTGFSCEKGEMIKSILYPTPERFHFSRETNFFLLGTVSAAILCIATCLYVFIKYYAPEDIIVRYFAGITLSVPPELPVVMSMGIIFSLEKLKKKNIYCINPQKIRAAGRVSIMVFDKTGTLTETELTVHSSKIYDGQKFYPKIRAVHSIVTTQDVWLNKDTYLENKDKNIVKYAECMACWHSISVFKGDYLGDTLDIEMFKTSRWVMQDDQGGMLDSNQNLVYSFYPPPVDRKLNKEEEIKGGFYKIRAVHKFDFSSELQRMSAIVKVSYDDDHICFVKGSPEKILELSEESTIPEYYNEVYNKHTGKGRRVIALAYRYLPNFNPESAETLLREDVEKDLKFLGFLIMMNELKPTTTHCIKQLIEGKF